MSALHHRSSAFLLGLLLLACSQRPAPPTAEDVPRVPPPLTGRTVFVLPPQPAPGHGADEAEAVAGLEADVGYFLAERAPGVRWILPAQVEKAARGSPTLGIRPRELQVDMFHRMKVERVGDPLFGDLHTLGVLLNARLALLPYAAAFIEEPGGTQGRVELALAIIDTSDGDVLWTGVVAGDRSERGSPAATASAASALARLLAR